MSNYCYNCMNPITPGVTKCPKCRHSPFVSALPHQLKPGTMLHDRYMIGRVLGQGGFGITYLGRDMVLNKRVAIKEYYPKDFSNRNHEVTNNVTVTTGDKVDAYRHGCERFLQEARILASFSEEPGVVSVQDFVEENNTAYIVMEYLPGTTLKQRIQAEGTIEAQKLFSMMDPLMHSLELIHCQGVIHRDISPDNIMIMPDGSIKLLDFGLARELDSEESRSVKLKPGYAPWEQYSSKGKQGPWTDVYALCATMYFCLTGKRPEEAPERVNNDSLKRPSMLGAIISPMQESVLLRGMAVNASKRYQSVRELQLALKDTNEDQNSVYTIYTSANNGTINKKPDDENLYGGNKKPPAQNHSIPAKKSKGWKKILLGLIIGAAFLTTLLVIVSKHNSAIVQKQTEAEETYNQSKKEDRVDVLSMQNISAGSGHTVAIKEDGSVVATGDNRDGQCDVEGWRDVVIVKAGFDCTFGIQKNGYAMAAGNNSFGRFSQEWEYLKDIAVDMNHVVGLRADGTVVALGQNENGECDTSAWTNIVAIDAGRWHTVGLKEDGSVVAVGDNSRGQCDVQAWRNIVAVSAGGACTIGLTVDGTVFAAGDNTYGQCNVQDWKDIIAVSTGLAHTVGLRADGTVVAVGHNSASQCNVEAWHGIVAISAGDAHTIGLLDDGTVFSAGVNTDGQGEVSKWDHIKIGTEAPFINVGLTQNDQEEYYNTDSAWSFDETSGTLLINDQSVMKDYSIENSVSAPWSGLTGRVDTLVVNGGITKIGDWALFSLVSMDPGKGVKTVYIPKSVTSLGEGAFEFFFDLTDVYYEGNETEWKRLTANQKSAFLTAATVHYKTNETLSDEEQAQTVSTDPKKLYATRKTISAGGSLAVGLCDDGTVVATGSNAYGQCSGVSDWTDIVSVAAMASRAIGVRADGIVFVAGYDKGQEEVSTWQNIVSVSAGIYHTVGLCFDGTVVAVGENEGGQCNVSDWNDMVAVAAGVDHTVGLRSDGTVVAVGNNDYNQCDVSSWRDIVAISAAYRETIGLRSNGTVIAVGSNEYGQCNVSNWKNIVAISASGTYTLGLQADGTVVAAGNNENGQCDVASWRDITDISAGGTFSVGLKADGTAVAVGSNQFGTCNVESWKNIKQP